MISLLVALVYNLGHISATLHLSDEYGNECVGYITLYKYFGNIYGNVTIGSDKYRVEKEPLAISLKELMGVDFSTQQKITELMLKKDDITGYITFDIRLDSVNIMILDESKRSIATEYIGVLSRTELN